MYGAENDVSLKIELKPGERFILDGCVVTNDNHLERALPWSTPCRTCAKKIS
jgi:hypothetical protein